MTLTKYGTDIAIPILVVSLLIFCAAFFISNILVKVIFLLLGVGVFTFTLNFFRDPDRITPSVDSGVISPADGTIVNMSEVDEPNYLGGKVKQVCIFMSPLNVHVNRFPVSGTVEFFKYIEGKYIAAFEDKSSDVNERTLIGINTGKHKILFKQIAGFVARRIVCPLKVGDTARVGERFGMIRFGSRVDILMPLDAEIQVQMQQRVFAGETVLAILQ